MLAANSGVVIELAFCHGAVVTVVYQVENGRPGAVRSNDLVVHFADAVSEEMRLRTDWIATDVAVFLFEEVADHTLQSNEFGPGVTLSVNGGARVLAHKLYLLRGNLPSNATDAADAEMLLAKVGFSTAGQIQYVYERAYPGVSLSEQAQGLIRRGSHARSLAEGTL
jgi:hypothetical protein